VDDPAKLRALAAWYREFAEQSGNPAIWDGRLHTAEDLETEAGQLETRSAQSQDETSAR
jgi:NADH:ubiquinone oxidoreductase subunit